MNATTHKNKLDMNAITHKNKLDMNALNPKTSWVLVWVLITTKLAISVDIAN